MGEKRTPESRASSVVARNEAEKVKKGVEEIGGYIETQEQGHMNKADI